MPSSVEPRSGIQFGWSLGENGWNVGMDANLLSIGRFAYHLSVKDRDLTSPPGSPTAGDSYIVGAAASGAWATHDGKVAVWSGTVWAFGVPRAGWRAWVEDEGIAVTHNGSAWTVPSLSSSSLTVSASSSSAAAKITQTGTGDALVVEDASSDSTPFKIDANGFVGFWNASPTAPVDIKAIDNLTTTEPVRLQNAAGSAVWSIGAYGYSHNLYHVFKVAGAERVRVASSGTALQVAPNPLSGSTTNVAVFSNPTFGSTATVRGEGFQTTLATEAASFTLAELGHFKAIQGTIGAGSAVTNQYGFLADSSIIGAANNYGFYSNIASGSGRWNFFANGTAPNHFSGNIGVGAGNTAPTAQVDVSGSLIRVRTAKTPSSATDAGNAGDICWDANFLYVCVATNTWKRSALSTW